jgi:hypothetical protein
MHSDWFNGIEILQGRWQHGERVGYCYPSGLEKILFKWDTHVPLVTKWVKEVLIQGDGVRIGGGFFTTSRKNAKFAGRTAPGGVKT